jgi:hypothetical protein
MLSKRRSFRNNYRLQIHLDLLHSLKSNRISIKHLAISKANYSIISSVEQFNLKIGKRAASWVCSFGEIEYIIRRKRITLLRQGTSYRVVSYECVWNRDGGVCALNAHLYHQIYIEREEKRRRFKVAHQQGTICIFVGRVELIFQGLHIHFAGVHSATRQIH